MPIVAIGPEIDRPTWSWVGFNLMRELSRYFDLLVFKPGGQTPQCDVLISIKEPVSVELWNKQATARVIYIPCDYYESEEQLEADQAIPLYSAILCHSERLVELIRKRNKNVYFIEHDSKYFLPNLKPYKKDGFVLWVGFSRYLNILKEWLSVHPISRQLVLLTDKPHEIAMPGETLQLRWTPRLQYELFTQASAALDIKGLDFNQLNKPPEKLQSYIGSGIPSACNLDSPVVDYFTLRGFNIAPPTDFERWFSLEYYNETVSFAEKLKKSMDLHSIGLQVRDIIKGLL